MEPRPEESSRLDSLASAVEDLRRRVAALECRSEKILESMPLRTPEAEGAHALGPLLPEMSGGAVAALGMALLGIAGAFVATYLGQAVGWYRPDEAAGLIGATVGALIVLFVWGMFARRTPA